MDDAKQLIRRYCRKGDARAFRAFYRLQANRLWRYLVARGCPGEDAYDVIGSAFLRLIQVVCKDPRAPVAFLYRIAHNLLIDQLRRDARAPVRTEPDPAAAAPAPERPEEHEFVRALVQTLPEDEQNLLLLRYWIGLSHKEIAGVLNRPEGTIRRQVSEAINDLRARWQAET